MNNEEYSTLPGPLAPPRRREELSVVGHVAMATGRDGRRTMPTGGVGSLVGGQPSGTVSGGLDRRHGRSARCMGRLWGSMRRARGEPMVCTDVQSNNSSTWYIKYYELQHCASIKQGSVNPAVLLSSSLPPRTKAGCERMWWTTWRSRTMRTSCFRKWSTSFIFYCIEQNFIQLQLNI